MENNNNSAPELPPSKRPSDGSVATREINDLLYPSMEAYYSLDKKVAILEERVRNFATREDLEKVKTWTLAGRNSLIVALSAAFASALMAAIIKLV